MTKIILLYIFFHLIVGSNSYHCGIIHRIKILYWGKKLYSLLFCNSEKLRAEFRVRTHASSKDHHSGTRLIECSFKFFREDISDGLFELICDILFEVFYEDSYASELFIYFSLYRSLNS